jgi:hypothetical protein
MTEAGTGVSLLWPISDRSFSFPHWPYVTAMVAIASVCLVRVVSTPRTAPTRATAISRG